MVLRGGLLRGASAVDQVFQGTLLTPGRFLVPFPTCRLGLQICPPHIPCGDVLDRIWYFRVRRRENIFRKIHFGGWGGVKTLRRLTSLLHLRQAPHSAALWASHAFLCVLPHGPVRFSVGPPAGEILLFKYSTYPAPPPCSPPRAAHAHGTWAIV